MPAVNSVGPADIDDLAGRFAAKGAGVASNGHGYFIPAINSENDPGLLRTHGDDEVSQLPARDRSGNQGAGMVERVALRAGQASTICRGRLPAHAREWDDLDAVA